MTIRKPHNGDAGYIAELRNHRSGGHTVIYVAERQAIDVGENKYVVVCDSHGTICGVRTESLARSLMKSAEFCEHCQRWPYRLPSIQIRADRCDRNPARHGRIVLGDVHGINNPRI